MQRILLAEDDASIVWMLGEYLRAEGYEVLHAPDEAGAVALLNAQPDLVLLDISLQSGTGYGVCREAKRRGLPVIFLTASGDENSVVEGLDMGDRKSVV